MASSPGTARHHAARAVVGLLAVAVLGTDVWLLLERNRTTTVELADALERFRSEAAPAGPTPVGPAEREPTPVVATDPGELARSAGDGVAPPPAVATGAPAATTAPGSSNANSAVAARAAVASTPTPAARYVRPAEGVYAYRTTGGESISVAGTSHTYPERTYGTVRHGDGCHWHIRNDVIEEHVDERILCSQEGSVLQLQQSRMVEFFGKRDGLTMVCDPALVLHAVAEAVGATHRTTCRGDGGEAAMTRTYLGRETMVIGGQPVDVEHVRIEGAFTGKATGRSLDDLWLVADTGLTARWTRMVDTKADAAFGAQVRYQENADFVLESLVPQR